MSTSLYGKIMEDERQRKRLKIVTCYEKCVEEQSNFCFCGMKRRE